MNNKENTKQQKEIEKENNECQCEEKRNCECQNIKNSDPTEEIKKDQKSKKTEEECQCKNKKKEKTGIFKKDNKELEELKGKVALLQESLLRNQAELQNYKKRKDEETAKILKYKDEDIIKEFLTILDNFERAIKMDDNDLTDEVSRFLEGFKLIYTNTLNMLSKFQVTEIEAEGVEFDPEYHHAVLTDHDENKPEGVILEVLQKGYMYKDRVIRPSMVKVNE